MKMRLLTLALCCLLSAVAFAAVVPTNSQTLTLQQGWNLVTLKCPITQEEVNKFLNLNPIRLDTEKQCYVRCANATDIQVGVGYWIYSASEEEVNVELALDLTQASWQTAGLGSGWSLVGVATNSNWQNGTSAIWQWQNDCFREIAKGDLIAGKAYFAKP